MAQPEALLCQKIIKQVEAHFECATLEKVHGSVFGAMKLDLRGSVDGYAIEIEVKLPGESPVPRQHARIRFLRKMRVITGWCTSPEDAIKLIELQLKERINGKAP